MNSIYYLLPSDGTDNLSMKTFKTHKSTNLSILQLQTSKHFPWPLAVLNLIPTWPDLSTSQGTGMGNARGKNPADETASLNTLTFKKKKERKEKSPFLGSPQQPDAVPACLRLPQGGNTPATVLTTLSNSEPTIRDISSNSSGDMGSRWSVV